MKRMHVLLEGAALEREFGNARFIKMAETFFDKTGVLLKGGLRERGGDALSGAKARAIPESFAACLAEK